VSEFKWGQASQVHINPNKKAKDTGDGKNQRGRYCLKNQPLTLLKNVI